MIVKIMELLYIMRKKLNMTGTPQATSQEVLAAASWFLEWVAKEFFTWAHGWQFNLRIDSHLYVLLCFRLF